MKTTAKIILALILALYLVPVVSARRVNVTTTAGGFITITAGTPIRLSTQPGTYADRLSLQARHGNVGVVYILMGVPLTTTCSASNAAQLSVELGAGTATQPGGQMSDPPGNPGATAPDATDLSTVCVDGTANGDEVLVSMWLRD